MLPPTRAGTTAPAPTRRVRVRIASCLLRTRCLPPPPPHVRCRTLRGFAPSGGSGSRGTTCARQIACWSSATSRCRRRAVSGWSGNASVRRAVPDPGAQHLRRRPYSRWPREAQPTHSRNDGCAAPRFFSARRFGLSCDAARRGVGGSETREPTRQFSNDDLTSRIVVSPWLSYLVVDKIR